MPAADDQFDQIINEEFHVNTPTENTNTSPYGGPVHPQKPGLTKRGKAGIAIGATVIASTSLIGYQAYAENTADKEMKVQELAIKAKALELEELRERNRATETDRKAAASQEKTRQVSIDTCVKNMADQVGKGYGSPSHRQVVSDCQAQYGSASTNTNLMAAGSTHATADGSTQTAGDGSGLGVQDGLLIGAAAVAGLVFFVRKGTNSKPA